MEIREEGKKEENKKGIHQERKREGGRKNERGNGKKVKKEA